MFLLDRRPRLMLLLGRRRTRGSARSPAGGRLRTVGSSGRLRALAVRARGLLDLGLPAGRTLGSAGWRPVLCAVAAGLIPRTRCTGALRTRRTGTMRCTLLPVSAHLDAVGGAVTLRSLGGVLFRIAFTHCHPPGPRHHQIPHSGLRAVLPVLTRATNRPRPRSRSNWNHRPQEPHLQVVPLLLLSRG